MQKGLIEQFDMKYLGAVFANLDDNHQAEFFNAMAKEMKSWGTSYQYGMQIVNIWNKLDDDAKDIFGFFRED